MYIRTSSFVSLETTFYFACNPTRVCWPKMQQWVLVFITKRSQNLSLPGELSLRDVTSSLIGWLTTHQPPRGIVDNSSSRQFIVSKYPGMVSFAMASRSKFLKWPLKCCYSMGILVGHWTRMTNYKELIPVLFRGWCPNVIVFQFQMDVLSRD